MALVVDLGSGLCKAGFSTDEKPRYVFPSVVGHYPVSKETRYVGRRASERMSKPIHLTYRKPLENGRIVDWNGVEQLITHLYEDVLGGEPDEHAVFMTNFRNIEDSGRAAKKVTEVVEHFKGHTDRRTDRQTDRQTNRQPANQPNRLTDQLYIFKDNI